MNRDLWDASKVFAPRFPRNSSDDGTMQAQRDSRGDFVAAMEAAANNEMPGYYSVYSFPRGHPQNKNLPRIDCIFIDLDVEGRHYDPDNPSMGDWRADMSALLARARMIGDAILEEGQEQHFRVVLSGHKGVHLYLDFPEIDPANGDFGQFKNGLKLYGQDVMKWLDDAAGGVNIDPWVDVDASDLARLARHPNTPHHGAAYDDTLRWCVPITVEELADLKVDDYLALTEGQRWLDEIERVPSETAHAKLVQQVRTAASSSGSSETSQRTQSTRNALKNYRENHQNDDISLDDVLFLTKDKPCIEAFRERDDAYEYGDASRAMELSIMGRLLDMGVPIETMHDFFEPIPGYDEDFTDSLIGDLLARGNEYGTFNCATIAGGYDDGGGRIPGQAPRFCLDESCTIYRRNDDIDKQATDPADAHV